LLNTAGGALIDEQHGGTITLPDFPGFALEIAPGSVIFPGGSRSGVVSVTAVHNDKVPMIPNFGQQPRFIVTIQPAGARFDPPARMTMPNLEGFAPGQVVEMYSFDHDLGHFVSIGAGTVGDDGLTVRSNLGVGVVKAGWHCCGYPRYTGKPNSCPDCAPCVGEFCEPLKLCSDCTPKGKVCDGDGKCLTGAEILPKICKPRQLSLDKDVTKESCEFYKPCGTGYVIVKPFRLLHSCGNADFKGALLKEHIEIVSDPCGLTAQLEVQTSDCPVQDNNLLACFDKIGICAPPLMLPALHCNAQLKQTVTIGPCVVEINRIEFDFDRDQPRKKNRGGRDFSPGSKPN